MHWWFSLRDRRCRYYVNSNFVIGLVEGRIESLEFARRHRGLCTSEIVMLEARLKGRETEPLETACREHNIRVLKLKRKTLSVLMHRAWRMVEKHGLSKRHIYDFIHMLIAKQLNAVYVTADRRSCNWAREMLGLECIYLPEWWKRAQELG